MNVLSQLAEWLSLREENSLAVTYYKDAAEGEFKVGVGQWGNPKPEGLAQSDSLEEAILAALEEAEKKADEEEEDDDE